MEQREARERLIAAISALGERCRKLLALKLEGKSFAEIQAIFGAGSINTDLHLGFSLPPATDGEHAGAGTRANDAGRDPQTAGRLRDGRAQRRTSGAHLFEAALEDQELFNALQNEDALKELLDDPVYARSSRQALETPAQLARPGFSWRRWVLGVAIPAVVAVIVIVDHEPREGAEADRAGGPDCASEPAPVEPSSPVQTPAVQTPGSRCTKKHPRPAAKERAIKNDDAAIQHRSASFAPWLLASKAPLAAAPRDSRCHPATVSTGFANAPLYQGPLVRYSLVRSGPSGEAVRVDVTPAIAGYLALYQVDAAGNCAARLSGQGSGGAGVARRRDSDSEQSHQDRRWGKAAAGAGAGGCACSGSGEWRGGRSDRKPRRRCCQWRPAKSQSWIPTKLARAAGGRYSPGSLGPRLHSRGSVRLPSRQA